MKGNPGREPPLQSHIPCLPRKNEFVLRCHEIYRAMHLQYRIHPTWISCLQPAVQHVEVPGLDQSTLGSPPGGVAEDDRQLECNHGGKIERYATLLQED